MTLKNIGVIGAGTMGNGIAQTCALCGFDVVMQDIAQAPLDNGMKTIQKSLERLVGKEKISTADYEAALARLKTTTDINAMTDRDLVIEAASENIEIKLGVFTQLNEICPDSTILATNTSSLSLTRIALMALVEVIRALQTSDKTYNAIEPLANSLGKTPVSVKDSPGFVVNRMLVPMINEAVFILYEGLAQAEDIDAAMKLGAAHPMGPLALADMIGLDVCLWVMNVLHEEFGDSKFRPCPLLKQMVDAGYLGRKTGRGFYQYGG